MTNETPTVQALATAKGLPVAALRSFGLSDSAAGVRFAYRTPSGEPGRTRLRTAMRGVDGSTWLPGDGAPVVAYCTPESLACARRFGYQLVVEGESDCWTAWFHGLPAVGIPGSANRHVLTLEHLPVTEVFVQVEAENARTYPGGVREYVAAVTAGIRAVGFEGDVHQLRFQDGVSDLSELYQREPGSFAAQLRTALGRSRQQADLG